MKTRRFLIALYAVLLLLAAFPVQAHAAFGTGGEAYRVPTITVLAYHAPEDLEIRVEVEKKGERFPADTLRTRRLWEQSFYLYREDVFKGSSFNDHKNRRYDEKPRFDRKKSAYGNRKKAEIYSDYIPNRKKRTKKRH